jgi:hypothetical protein
MYMCHLHLTVFAAGELVKILVGFTNAGEKDFVVDTIDAAFH